MRARRRVERIGCIVRGGGKEEGELWCGEEFGCLRTAWTLGTLKVLAKRGFLVAAKVEFLGSSLETTTIRRFLDTFTTSHTSFRISLG